MVSSSGSKNRKRSFPKGLKREARNCQQRGVKRAQRPRGTVWMKKVRNIRWHTVLIDTLKTDKQFCNNNNNKSNLYSAIRH